MFTDTSVMNVLFMASDEMDQIVEFNEKFYKKFSNKITFYFGSDDGWVNKSIISKVSKICKDSSK